MIDGGTASTEYDVPYHGSAKFVFPSNFFDSQNILIGNMESKERFKQREQKNARQKKKISICNLYAPVLPPSQKDCNSGLGRETKVAGK
jgi:hypothetical protein